MSTDSKPGYLNLNSPGFKLSVTIGVILFGTFQTFVMFQMKEMAEQNKRTADTLRDIEIKIARIEEWQGQGPRFTSRDADSLVNTLRMERSSGFAKLESTIADMKIDQAKIYGELRLLIQQLERNQN